jgi:hypothetical protein
MRVKVSRAIIRSKEHQRSIYQIGLDKYKGSKEEILKSIASSISILFQSTQIPTKEYFELVTLFRNTFNEIYGYKYNVQ